MDLSTAGSSGFINGAYFEQGGTGPAATGASFAFVRIQTNSATEQGYNTDGRPIEFGEVNTSPAFTRSLPLSSLAVVNRDGIDYRVFRLDINESSSGTNPLLSLDALQIFLAPSGDLTGYPALGTMIFDLDTPTADNWILLNAALTSGGGGGAADMSAFIPNGLFVGGDYVYLYSRFGASEDSAYPNNGGYEEWSALRGTTPPVPAPGALLLVLIGSPLAVRLRRLMTL